MNRPKVIENLKSIIETIDSTESGKISINKCNVDSNYQEHVYTPEVLLAHIKDFATAALKGINEYE